MRNCAENVSRPFAYTVREIYIIETHIKKWVTLLAKYCTVHTNNSCLFDEAFQDCAMYKIVKQQTYDFCQVIVCWKCALYIYI
jgi:hypothetical protein